MWGLRSSRSRSGPPVLSALNGRVAALCDAHAALWEATPCELPELGPPTSLRRRFVNARAAAHLIDDLAAEAERVPDDRAQRRTWQEAVRARLQDFGAARLGWPAGYRRLLFAEGFYASARAFARDARALFPELPLPRPLAGPSATC